MLIQQGDVLIRSSAEIDPDAVRRAGKIMAPGARGVILAEGEATGHAHVVRGNAELVEVPREQLHTLGGLLAEIASWDAYDGRILVAHTAVEIVHEEHGVQRLPKGVYPLGRVREWDYAQHEARKVPD